MLNFVRIYKNFCFYPSALDSLNKITVIQYRNYSSASFDFRNTVTCITGPNGSGKTNLLDAVYLLCYTKSYFTAYQQNNVQSGLDGFRVNGQFTLDGKNETITCKWKGGKKEVYRNEVEYEKVTDHIGRFSAVMIAPDDTELINGSSELRRKWIDGILSQVDKNYLERLMRYHKVLLQRNAWLKNESLRPGSDKTAMEYYDAELAIDGTYIFERRQALLAEFIPIVNDFYHRLSAGTEPVSITYTSDLAQKKLADWLAQNLQYDLRYQRTLRGVHKDDWELNLNNMALKQFGSQGQKKSFLFAMKLAQYAYLKRALGHLPILLLDDIFEKLDQQRIEALLAIIKEGFGQVILTDTHAERISAAFGADADVGFICL